MMWLFFILLTVLMWGGYNLFFKGLGNTVHPYLLVLFVGIGQIMISIPLLMFNLNKGNIIISLKGITITSVMGILLGLGTIFFFIAFKHGAKSSVGIAVYTVGALILGVIGSLIIYHEKFTLQTSFGFIVGIISILLLTIK